MDDFPQSFVDQNLNVLLILVIQMWKIYKNTNGNSGVLAYEIGINFICVRFKNGSEYKYTYESTGDINIEQMKMLAESGKGLSTFISQHVRKKFAEKLR